MKRYCGNCIVAKNCGGPGSENEQRQRDARQPEPLKIPPFIRSSTGHSVSVRCFYNNTGLTSDHKHTVTYDNVGRSCAWGHSEAGKPLCNLDGATHEVPGWPASGFSRLASAGVTGMTSSVPHISHPPACLDQACSHSDDRKAKELQRHIVPFRSRLRSGKTTTSGANASHKANFGVEK